MSPQYTAEIFHPSSSVHSTVGNAKASYPFEKVYWSENTFHIGPKTWNNLPDQIKLSKNVNTFKHDIKKSFFMTYKNKTMIILLLLDTVFQTCYMLRTYMICLYLLHLFLFSQRDHNENKVYPDLYYAIPATVS